jgi:peptidoglycan hydrolase CwlO-like protein
MNGVMTLLLIGTLVYFLVFHESPIIERYQSEIATLKTKNEQLVTDFENLQKEKEISKKITEQLDKGLNNINKELKSVNYEIYILNKNRDKKEPFVNNLPNDSIAGEFTKYLQRRNQTR